MATLLLTLAVSTNLIEFTKFLESKNLSCLGRGFKEVGRGYALTAGNKHQIRIYYLMQGASFSYLFLFFSVSLAGACYGAAAE